MKFEELEFKPHSIIPGAKRARIDFNNGYSASIVSGHMGHSNKYEVAIIRDNKIVYDTPIADDVISYLTKEGVEKVLDSIAALPPAERNGT